MRRILILSGLLALPALAFANSLSFEGSLDPTNPNDVFLVSFNLASKGTVLFQSYGYGGTSSANVAGTNAAGLVIPGGGFDSYLSLFQGIGNSATFLASNDDGSCPRGTPDPVCADSTLTETGLAAGNYTLAITLPFNFSFAENYGSGTLGDGFIGLQSSYYDAASNEVRTSNYALDIITGDARLTVVAPEPDTLSLLIASLVVAGAMGAFKQSARK